MDDGPRPSPPELYERDTHAWAMSQAAALRDFLAGRPAEPDWGNIVEEIESLGRGQTTALRSRVGNILVHLLKLAHARDAAPRRNWQMTVVEQRTRLERLLDENPSLRPHLAEIVATEFPRAARQAAKELGFYGDRAGVAAVRGAAPLSAEQVAGDWWPEEG
jgi:hypothetical protein